LTAAALLTATAAAAASSSDLMASPAVVTAVRYRRAAEEAGPPKSAHNSEDSDRAEYRCSRDKKVEVEDGRRYLPIGANLPRMRESATTEQSMSARRAAFPSRLGSPLAELRVFISLSLSLSILGRRRLRLLLSLRQTESLYSGKKAFLQ